MAAADPIALFEELFARARRTGMRLPHAMALATASRSGMPSVRWVLLKQVDARGFTFFTDGRSRKGRDLASNPCAGLAFYWHPLGKQVRIEGRVERVTRAEADAYWASRPRESRLAALASLQDAEMPSRAWLEARWRALARRHRGGLVPRPAAWTGYRVVPERIEFWTRRAHRLHHRELFVRGRRGWTRRLLQP
jgi:pyridoxamine 5'-phosphate oxidase